MCHPLSTATAKRSLRVPRAAAVLDVMLPGELFGLPGLFSGTADRVGESMATEPSVALSIERDALVVFLERHPPAMRRTQARLSDLVREYAQAMMLSTNADLGHRVARLLHDLADLYGEPAANAVRICAPVSREALEAIAGASR